MFYFLAILAIFANTAKADWQEAPPWPASVGSMGENMVADLNLARLNYDLKMLQFDDQLTCAASLMAAQGTCLNIPLLTRIRLCGGKHARIGQLMACGEGDYPNVIDAWMRDAKTKEIIMNDRYATMGAAKVGSIWVAILGEKVE